MYSFEPAVIAMNETLADRFSCILDCEILPSGFHIFRKDRSSHGGGVLLAVSNTLSASLLSSQSHLEVLSVKLDLKQLACSCICCVCSSFY